jgi:hypothetical protein
MNMNVDEDMDLDLDMDMDINDYIVEASETRGTTALVY